MTGDNVTETFWVCLCKDCNRYPNVSKIIHLHSAFRLNSYAVVDLNNFWNVICVCIHTRYRADIERRKVSVAEWPKILTAQSYSSCSTKLQKPTDTYWLKDILFEESLIRNSLKGLLLRENRRYKFVDSYRPCIVVVMHLWASVLWG